MVYLVIQAEGAQGQGETLPESRAVLVGGCMHGEAEVKIRGYPLGWVRMSGQVLVSLTRLETSPYRDPWP